MRYILALGIVLLFVTSTGFADTADKAAPVKKAEPQMAGMGFGGFPSVQRHECARAMQSCMTGCKSITGADCAQDCANDCEVCALDVGEDAAKICKK